MTPRTAIRDAIDNAARSLAAAGIGSARVDAELLAAHLAGVDRGRLLLADLPPDFADRYRRLVAARARRIPLQHLTGVAPFGPLLLHVGPGVFIPRPETEALLEWATKSVSGQPNPTIVDLCTGTGALALALSHARPDARVFAVDDSPEALRYAYRNVAGSPVQLIEGDATDPALLTDLNGRVDLLVCNPPYIPEGAELDPEVAEHDPHHALFGGPDGMAVISAVVLTGARLLRPGGLLAIEHDDTTSAQTAAAIAGTGLFDDVVTRFDLAGRLRFVTGARSRAESEDR